MLINTKYSIKDNEIQLKKGHQKTNSISKIHNDFGSLMSSVWNEQWVPDLPGTDIKSFFLSINSKNKVQFNSSKNHSFDTCKSLLNHGLSENEVKVRTWFPSTFTGLGLKDLVRTRALVLHDLNDHSSGAGLATSGLKATTLQASQLTSAPRWPLSQMAVSWGQKKKMHRSITMSGFNFSVFYIQLAETISGVALLAPLLAPGTFKTDRKQLQHTPEVDNVPNAKTNYSDSPVGFQK